MDLVTPRGFQSQIQRIGHVLCPHVCAQLPRDNVATVIIKDRAEIEPTPANDLEIGKVRLPKLIDGRGFVFELVCSFDHDEGWAGDQVMCLEDTVDGSLRYKVTFLICEGRGQLPW